MTPYILLLVTLIFTWLEFYLPGGVFAVVAGCLFIAAQVSIWADSGSLLALGLFFIASCLLVGFVIYFAIHRIRKSAKNNTFFLATDQEGYKASGFSEKLIGKKGVTLTECCPSGYILVDGERHAAISRGTYLDKGCEVVVIAGEGGNLIIKSNR